VIASLRGQWQQGLVGLCFILAFSGLALCLCGGAAWAREVPGLGQVLAEIGWAIGAPATQWLVALCLTSYLAAFTVLRRQFTRERWLVEDAAESWLVLALVWSALRYGGDYSAQPLGTGFLVLLAGMTMGQGAAAWVAWRGAAAETVQRRLLAWLVLLLAAGLCWHPSGGMQFEYRGTLRWSGPWENPNTFGGMMGTGLVLAVGLAVAGCRMPDTGCRWARGWRAARMMVWLGLAGGFAFGCLRSYSRGAWLGTALALGYLGYQVLRFSSYQGVRFSGAASAVVAESVGSLMGGPRREWWRMLVRHRVAVVTIAVSLGVLVFWSSRQSELRVARRVVSVGNVNDFSWRNRVAAWEGALAMIGDRPWFGWGWGAPEQVYAPLYLAERSEEGLAIRLNDYLMLAMSAGLPGLVGFAGFVMWGMRGRMPDARCRMPDAGCQMPDAGCRMPDAGCRMPDAGYAGVELSGGGGAVAGGFLVRWGAVQVAVGDGVLGVAGLGERRSPKSSVASGCLRSSYAVQPRMDTNEHEWRQG